MPAPVIEPDRVRFRFAPRDGDVTGVVLQCDRAIDGPREFTREGTTWELALPRPRLDRIEYRFVVGRDEDLETILDPDCRTVVRTAFGERSVLELPGYRPPAWVAASGVAGRYTSLVLGGERDLEVPVAVWAPADLPDDRPAPLLVVHDGPEYDALAGLTRYSAAQIAAGALPPHRLALAHPVLRDAWYSGSPRYLRTIAHHGLDAIGTRYAVHGPVAVMGASLGGLTSLLAGLIAAPRVGAVFAQSGSFFQVRHDAMEEGYPWFGRIARLVQDVLDTRHTEHPLRIGMTCGALEENAANNRDMALALRRAGHDVTYAETADLHSYTAWRDALDPTLTRVLQDVWSDG